MTTGVLLVILGALLIAYGRIFAPEPELETRPVRRRVR